MLLRAFFSLNGRKCTEDFTECAPLLYNLLLLPLFPLVAVRIHRFSALLMVMSLVFAPLTSASAATLECADGIDNDRDGRIDYPADDDCDSRIDNLEQPSRADLTVTLTDGNAYSQRGALLTYTLTIRNNLTEPFDVPARVSLSNLTYVVDAGSAEEVDSRTIRWPLIQLAAREAKTFTFTARVVDHTPDNAGVLARAVVSTASATDQTIIRSGALPPPDVSVRISDGQTNAARGEVLTYTVELKNDSSYNANDVHVSAALPFLEEFVSADQGGTWDGRNVRWWKVQIPARGSIMLHFNARVSTDADDGRTLQASVEALDVLATETTTVGGTAAASSRSSRATTAGAPAVVFYADADRAEALAGGVMNVTLSVRNTGDAMSNDLIITQTYDPSAVSPAEGAGATSVQPGKMTWALPPLAPGESWQTTVPMAVAAHAGPGQTQTTVSIVGSGVDGVNAVRSVDFNILRELPATGAAFDALVIVLAAFAALGLAVAHRKALRR